MTSPQPGPVSPDLELGAFSEHGPWGGDPDQVPPEPFNDIRLVVERDFGRPLAALFSEFSQEPLAAASIAQVHAARLRTGEEVVVKVQRPQVGTLVREDLAALAWLAPKLIGRIPVASLANPPALLQLFAEQVVDELD